MITRTTVRMLAAAAVLLACTINLPAARYRFRSYGHEQGLNTAASRLLQDRTGFLWVGTGNGLYRYDGAAFTRFGIEEGLPSVSIRCLLETPDGSLWVVTGRGVSRFHDGAFSPVNSAGVAKATDLTSIAVSPSGKVYLGTGHGLLVNEGPDSLNFALLPAAGSAAVAGVLVEPSGTVWFSRSTELCRLDRTGITVFGAADGLPPERWGAMLVDRAGDLWLRGPNHLYRRDKVLGVFEARDRGLPQSSNTLLDLAQDRTGTMMVTTDVGLARWIDGRWELTGTAQGLESETVTGVLEDREGSLWMSLWGAGVARWQGYREWTNWTTADGLSSNIVWAVKRDPKGAVWAGTDRGLVRMEGDAPPRVWTVAEGLAGDKVKALAIGPDGAVWAGCLPGGVSRINPVTGKVRRYGHDAGLTEDRVIALYLDPRQRLWVSTAEGLFRADRLDSGLRFERQHPPGTTLRTMFYRFASDQQGRMLVGSTDGLLILDNGNWTRYTTAQGLRSNAVTHAAVTDDGAIWLGYREPLGLTRLHPQLAGASVSHFTKHDGLPSDYVLFLGLDAGRRLWMGTDDGVAVRGNGRWTLHSQDDGLVWDDCAAGAFLAEADGTVWVGTLKGLARYRPDPLKQVPPAPRTMLTGARFGGVAANPSATVTVPFRQRDVFVQFTALTFVGEPNVRYRYRLLGLDDSWIDTRMREVRFQSLPAGTYTFEVLARSAKGVWSETPARLNFKIDPPWWGTWWFYVVVVLSLLAVGATVWRWRVDAYLQRQRELEDAVRERTRELEAEKAALVDAREALRELAMRDGLTGLWNRNSTIQLLQQELIRAQREPNLMAVMLMDLDHFKDVNDTYGHLVGDEVLREAANRMRQAVRPYDCVGRYGGEEFLLAAPVADPTTARERAEAVLAAIGALPFHTAAGDIGVTCSVGVSWCADGQKDVKELIGQADVALYQAKAQGRNTVVMASDDVPTERRQTNVRRTRR